MKIVVLGATGSTGQLLTALALAQGHEVTAVVRRLGVLAPQPQLHIVQGSVQNSQDLQQAFSGADVVISCLGQRPGLRAFCLGSQFQRQSLPAIISAINAAQVPRFVLMSSFGAGASAAQAGWFLRTFLYGLIAKKMFDDKAIAEQCLNRCLANWTALYPVTLLNLPTLQNAQLIPLDQVRLVPGLPWLSFATVAQHLLQLAGDQQYAGKKLLLCPAGVGHWL